MIKITKGTVGVHIDGRNTMRSYNDPPFSLDEETEARFVALGVAAYYSTGEIGPETAAPVNVNKKAADTEKAAESETEEADTEDDDTLESMSFPELRNFAKQMGLSASGKREDIITRINEANQVTL